MGIPSILDSLSRRSASPAADEGLLLRPSNRYTMAYLCAPLPSSTGAGCENCVPRRSQVPLSPGWMILFPYCSLAGGRIVPTTRCGRTPPSPPMPTLSSPKHLASASSPMARKRALSEEMDLNLSLGSMAACCIILALMVPSTLRWRVWPAITSTSSMGQRMGRFLLPHSTVGRPGYSRRGYLLGRAVCLAAKYCATVIWLPWSSSKAESGLSAGGPNALSCFVCFRCVVYILQFLSSCKASLMPCSMRPCPCPNWRTRSWASLQPSSLHMKGTRGPLRRKQVTEMSLTRARPDLVSFSEA
mmetsp:Transcript_6555/g.14970  ORF Transcript_6555/g.14970 Transcript_6555/m.14970 type:complete len:301 (-) Transcript_6555:1040-1942(-)